MPDPKKRQPWLFGLARDFGFVQNRDYFWTNQFMSYNYETINGLAQELMAGIKVKTLLDIEALETATLTGLIDLSSVKYWEHK